MADVEQNLVANTRQFQKAVSEEVPAALEDMSASLDDVVRDGERAGERLERSFREVADAAQRESRKVGDDFERNTDRGMSRASDAVADFKGEAIQNLGELASSFDGTVQGVADGIQGLAGGASVGLIQMGGPIAGIGAALAGIGIIGGTVFQQIADDAEASEQRIADMYDDMLESGQNYLSQQHVLDAINDIVKDQDLYNAALERSKILGVDIATVLAAEVSSGEERNRLLALADQMRRDALQNTKAGADYTDEEAAAAARVASETAKVVDHYLTLNGEQTSAIDKVNQAREAQELLNAKFSDGQRIVEETGAEIDSWPELQTIRIEPDVPSGDEIARRVTASLNGRRVRVPAEFVTRNGTVVF